MTVFVGLLRGINVGGANVLKMADLKKLVGDVGYAPVFTLLQSGNVAFAGKGDAATARRKLEAALDRRMGKPIPTLVLTRDELDAAIKANPLPVANEEAGRRMVVVFLSEAPDRAKIDAFLEAHDGPEVCAVKGRALYVDYVNGIARSKLKVDGKLAGVATARNWNTANKLAALAAEIDA